MRCRELSQQRQIRMATCRHSLRLAMALVASAGQTSRRFFSTGCRFRHQWRLSSMRQRRTRGRHSRRLPPPRIRTPIRTLARTRTTAQLRSSPRGTRFRRRVRNRWGSRRSSRFNNTAAGRSVRSFSSWRRASKRITLRRSRRRSSRPSGVCQSQRFHLRRSSASASTLLMAQSVRTVLRAWSGPLRLTIRVLVRFFILGLLHAWAARTTYRGFPGTQWSLLAAGARVRRSRRSLGWSASRQPFRHVLLLFGRRNRGRCTAMR